MQVHNAVNETHYYMWYIYLVKDGAIFLDYFRAELLKISSLYI